MISVVFIGRVSESRNCAANEPLANESLNHHSAVAKDQPSILTACAELQGGKHKTAKRRSVEEHKHSATVVARREDEASPAFDAHPLPLCACGGLHKAETSDWSVSHDISVRVHLCMWLGSGAS